MYSIQQGEAMVNLINEIQQPITGIVKGINTAAKGSTKMTYDKCKEDRTRCLLQVIIDGIALVSMYMLAIYVIDGTVITMKYLKNQAAKYMLIYTVCSFVLRYLDVDYEDALSRGAAVVIAAKFVTALAPDAPKTS